MAVHQVEEGRDITRGILGKDSQAGDSLIHEKNRKQRLWDSSDPGTAGSVSI